MTVTQTVDIPESYRITIDVPREIPTGRTIISFTPEKYSLQKNDPRTVTEALEMAEKQAADPNRKPISRLFGKHKGIFGGDGVTYQRSIRDEWN